MRGFFISFCGLDGSGKTTQANLLKNYITETLDWKATIIPGYRPSRHVESLKRVSNKIGVYHEDVFTSDVVSLSLLSDLWENTQNYILPAMNDGNVVITERYWESSKIYAPILGSNQLFIENLIRLFPNPDVYIYMDIDPEVSYQRVLDRSSQTGQPITPKESLDIMIKAREKYLEFVNNTSNCLFVDVREKSPKEIHQQVIAFVSERMRSD